MNAEEARVITKKSLSGEVIKPLLDAVYAKIQRACVEGRSSITHPWQGMVLKYPTLIQQEAVYKHLSHVDGYTVTQHPNPDPGDPRSSSYTEISW